MRLGSNIIVLSLATRISFAEATFFFTYMRRQMTYSEWEIIKREKDKSW